MKVTVIEIRQHQSINILIKLNKFKDIINNLRISGTQKIQLAIANKFVDNDEEVQCIEKVIITVSDEADKVKKEPFDSHKNRYQIIRSYETQ